MRGLVRLSVRRSSSAPAAAGASNVVDAITRYTPAPGDDKVEEPIFARERKGAHKWAQKEQKVDYDARDAVYGRETFSLDGLRVVPFEMRVANEGALRNSLQREQSDAARIPLDEEGGNTEASADDAATAGWKKDGRKRVIDMDAVEGLPDTVPAPASLLSASSPLATPAPRDTAKHSDLAHVGRYFDLKFSASTAAQLGAAAAAAPVVDAEDAGDNAVAAAKASNAKGGGKGGAVDDEAAKQLNRYPLPEDLAHEFASTGREALMVRAPAANVIKSLVAFEEGKFDEGPERAIVFTGRFGQGKAASLAHVVHHCHSRNWLTLAIANPAVWGTKQPVMTPSPHDETLFDQHDFSAEMLSGLVAMNEALLGELPCQVEPDESMTTRALEKRRPTTLLELARRAQSDREGATGPAIWMLNELAQLTTVPVLIAVHGLEAMYRETGYYFRGEALAPQQMRLMRAFRYFAEQGKGEESSTDNSAVVAPVASLSNGFFAATMTQPGIAAVGGSRSLREYIHHTPNYSIKETEGALRHYQSCNFVTQPLSMHDVHMMHTKTGGNPRELRKEIPISLL